MLNLFYLQQINPSKETIYDNIIQIFKTQKRKLFSIKKIKKDTLKHQHFANTKILTIKISMAQ